MPELFCRRKERSHYREDTEYKSDHERARLDAACERGRQQIGLIHVDSAAHFRSCSEVPAGAISGRTPPLGGSPRNFGGGEGIGWPGGTSVAFAFWLICNART